jgi:methylenetetrahydrofolate reductase (NADPH)
LQIVRRWSVRNSRFIEAVWQVFEVMLNALSPLLRLIPRRFLEVPLRPAEHLAKRVMFDCQMCGQCVLSLTGISCPMNCPKTLRNGPCGGVLADGGCEVKPAMTCVWLDAWDGSARMKNSQAITEIQHPVSHLTKGRSTWAATLQADHSQPAWPEISIGSTVKTSDDVPAAASSLQRILNAGAFTVTTEFNAPDTAAAEDIIEAVQPLTGITDGVNVTDNAGANVHISSLSVCAAMAREGFEPVMQMTCRDRNRMAIQSDVLGAATLGVTNITCMTGDAITSGDHPDGKPVFDLDATSLLQTIRHLRDEGKFLTGRELKSAPYIYMGATANPSASNLDVEINRVAKKVRAGAQYLQTQYCFDQAALQSFVKRYRDEGLDEWAHLLVGVGPLRSAKSGRWMRDHIPGIHIPDDVLDRIGQAEDELAEGQKFAADFIEELKEMPAISGVHIMAIGQPRRVAQIIEKAQIGPKFRS